MKPVFEIIIYVCMFGGLYLNWTDLPAPKPRPEGPLILIGD